MKYFDKLARQLPRIAGLQDSWEGAGCRVQAAGCSLQCSLWKKQGEWETPSSLPSRGSAPWPLFSVVESPIRWAASQRSQAPQSLSYSVVPLFYSGVPLLYSGVPLFYSVVPLLYSVVPLLSTPTCRPHAQLNNPIPGRELADRARTSGISQGTQTLAQTCQDKPRPSKAHQDPPDT